MAIEKQITWKNYPAEYWVILLDHWDKVSGNRRIRIGLFKDETSSKETNESGVRTGLDNNMLSFCEFSIPDARFWTVPEIYAWLMNQSGFEDSSIC